MTFGMTMSWLNMSVSSHTRSLESSEPRKMNAIAMIEYGRTAFLPNRYSMFMRPKRFQPIMVVNAKNSRQIATNALPRPSPNTLPKASCARLVFATPSAEQQKQFITDASHELKTPITVIATSLKVLEMETGKQKWIDKAQAQTEKLTELVNSMVTLSRMDEEESPLRMEEFNVSDAVEETAGSFSDFALSHGHEMRINVEPGIKYRGDEYAVRQLVSILLDNAVKYAADATPISVELCRVRKGVVLRAENTCVSPENIDTEKLFDRFYRADPSRSESGAGFGIGLSIARSIAEGHKGHISAEIIGDKIVFEAELK